jgi:hypothetical protein
MADTSKDETIPTAPLHESKTPPTPSETRELSIGVEDLLLLLVRELWGADVKPDTSKKWSDVTTEEKRIVFRFYKEVVLK